MQLSKTIADDINNSITPSGCRCKLWIHAPDGVNVVGCAGFPPATQHLIATHNAELLPVVKQCSVIATTITKKFPDMASRQALLRRKWLGSKRYDQGMLIIAMLAASTDAELTPEILTGFQRLFWNDSVGFYLQQRNGTYKSHYQKLELQDIHDHLTGKKTIGFPALGLNGISRWVCFDDDNLLAHSAEGNLERIERHLSKLGIHSLREAKRADGEVSKQGHLWVLLEKPIPASIARAWAKKVLEELGLTGAPNLELFPKQSQIGTLGNCVRGPLGKHAKDNRRRGRFRNAPYPLEDQLSWLLSQPLNPVETIMETGAFELKLIEARNKYRTNFVAYRHDDDGPSVLEMLEGLTASRKDGGDRWLFQCPLCADEGHDKSQDNLHVGMEHTWYGCWYGGWNAKHTYSAIYKRLIELSKQANLPPR